MTNIVEKLKRGENLTFEESKFLFAELMEGKYAENSIIEILEAFTKKGETKDELAGGIYILREKANRVKSDQNTIDTCGTGGDGKNSLNISTAAAIALSSMGIKVAKHGNKAVSSNCGSADVLEALKININLKPNEAEESINKNNFAFMFAPNYHSAMKHVASARKKMGKKTIFNLIGPLSSPAQVKRQVIGVFHKKWMMPFAEALRENDVVHAYIVHSDGGMDEISPFTNTNVVEV
jgi:anthranilate phosphoribosyltransferase